MKNKTVLTLVVISFLVLNLQNILADSRPIYVGDEIELSIDKQVYSIGDIEDAFKDFDMIDINEVKDAYVIKIRSFDVGEHSISLGNSQIIISVSSLLSEDKTDIISENLVIDQPWFVLPWTMIKYISLVLAISGMLLLLVWKLKNKAKKPKSNYESFKYQIKALDVASDDYAYLLTQCFKTYISRELHQHIQGLSTKECITLLKDLPEVKEIIDDLKIWLNKSDVFKYSKNKANKEGKLQLQKELIAIVESIDKQSIDKQSIDRQSIEKSEVV